MVTGLAGVRARGAAAAAGLALDRFIGDPPNQWHPVAWFGQAMGRREQAAWRDDRVAGITHLVVGLSSAGGAAYGLRAAARRVGGVAGELAIAAVISAAVVGARSLDRAAGEIEQALLEGKLVDARRLLPSLVGRDPTGLDEAEIARAVVESVAENSVDAVVAPLFWAAALGPAGASAYRAVNTLDAMVGHRSERYQHFGWASARLDDAANYLPARLAAAVVAAMSPTRSREVVRAVRQQAPGHPSPNAGVIEAAFAASLGLRLGGTNRYGKVFETRVTLGHGRPPTAADISRARALACRMYLAVAALLCAPAAASLPTRLLRSGQPKTMGGSRRPGRIGR